MVHESEIALAACTLLTEPKFLRGGSLVAHLEALFPALLGDPSSAAEDQTAGHAMLITEALSRARAAGCYKLLFDSSSTAESALMLRLGLKRSQLTMSQSLASAGAGSAAAPLLATLTFPTLGDGSGRSRTLTRPPTSASLRRCACACTATCAWRAASSNILTLQLRRATKQPSVRKHFTALILLPSPQLSVAAPMDAHAFDTHLSLVRRSGMHRVTVVEDTSARGALVCEWRDWSVCWVEARPWVCG